MAGSDTKRYGELFGRGMLFHGDGDAILNDFEQCSIRFMSNETELPRGNLTLDNMKLYFKAGAELTIGFHSIGPEVLALMLGGTATANLGLHATEDEVQTVPANPGPYTVTVTNSTIATVGTTAVLSAYTISTAGAREYYDQAAAAAADTFSISGQTMTFDASDAEDVVYISYMYTDTTGTQVAWNPDDLPSKFTFYGVMNWLDQSGDPTQQFGVELLNVLPKPDFELGASRASHNPLTLTCAINNDATGDCIFYFDV